MPKCIIQAGGTGAGKTTYTKKILANHKGAKFIYDVNNEYGLAYMTMDQFLTKALTLENTLIVFEEATIFFDTHGSNQQIKEMLVRKRHTKNLFIFNFHGLAQVPNYIYTFADYLNVFKTNDQIPQIERKYKFNETIFETFKQVKKSRDPHKHILLKLR